MPISQVALMVKNSPAYAGDTRDISLIPGSGRSPEVCVCVCVQSLRCVQLFATPWTIAHQALLSMGFSRQEYWSGLPFPPPRIFSIQDRTVSPGFHVLAGGSLPLSHLRSRKWQPTPVFLLIKVHGQRSLMGYSPWSHKESDRT